MIETTLHVPHLVVLVSVPYAIEGQHQEAVYQTDKHTPFRRNFYPLFRVTIYETLFVVAEL